MDRATDTDGLLLSQAPRMPPETFVRGVSFGGSPDHGCLCTSPPGVHRDSAAGVLSTRRAPTGTTPGRHPLGAPRREEPKSPVSVLQHIQVSLRQNRVRWVPMARWPFALGCHLGCGFKSTPVQPLKDPRTHDTCDVPQPRSGCRTAPHRAVRRSPPPLRRRLRPPVGRGVPAGGGGARLQPSSCPVSGPPSHWSQSTGRAELKGGSYILGERRIQGNDGRVSHGGRGV